MSTAQDLPGLYGEPLSPTVPTQPALRLVTPAPLDFDDAVRRVRPRLHRYAIRRLGDSHEAEELVQEALLRAYTHRDQLHTEEDLSAWATVVTGRLVIDRLRVRGRSTSVADVPEGARVGRDTADVVVARDEARTALDALDAMPSRQASLLWAREVEGKSYEELCAQFTMTEPAVRSVLTRARKSLRKEYELRGGTVPVGGLAVLAPWIAGLSWAEKARRAAHRLTAPAALGAAGIAALGGLVLSPFGADHAPGTTTFTPAQAIVSSAIAPAPAAPTESPLHGLPATAGSGAGAAAAAADVRPVSLLGRGGIDTHKVPCTSAAMTADQRLVALAQSPSTPLDTSIGAGGSQCEGSHTVTYSVGPDLPEPVAARTGYDHVSISTDLVRCTAFKSLTARTATPTTQLIDCSETQR